VSRIYDALTIADEQVVERFKAPIAHEGRKNRSPEGVTLPIDISSFWTQREPGKELAGRVALSRKAVRNYLLLAFLTVGGILVGTNYAFRPNTVGWAATQNIHAVAFEGTLRPAKEIRITTPVVATVSEIYVKVGDPVRVGQQLIRLDDRDSQMALQQAAVERQAAVQNLASFRARLADANARVAVAQRRAAEVPMRQRGDSPARAQAAYDQAMVSYNRAKQLHDLGVIAQQELDARATELRVAEDDLENARKLAGASASLERNQSEQADLEAQVTRQELLEQLRQADLKYQQAKQRVDESVVRATQTGVVAEIPVKIGDRVGGGTILARLAELRRMIADVPVAAGMIAELRPGQAVQIQLPSNPPTQVEGTIRTINPLPSPNMTHNVEVEFENPTMLLLAGQPAEIRFVKQ
jgi:multidrug resistance efflux pump